MISRCFFGILAFFAFLQTAHAQGFSIDDAVKWTEPHKIPKKPKVGDEITFIFKAQISPGFHVYSAKQPSDAVNPARFELDKTSKGVKIIGELQESGHREEIFDDIFRKKIAFYHDAVTFSQKIKITEPDAVIQGHLDYDACNDNGCLNGDREINLKISAAGIETSPTPAIPPTPNSKLSPPSSDSQKLNPAVISPIIDSGQVERNAGSDNAMVQAVTWAAPSFPVTPTVGSIIKVWMRGKIQGGKTVLGAEPATGMAFQPAVFELDPSSKNVELVGELKEGFPHQVKKDASGKEIFFFKDSVAFLQEVKITGDKPIFKGYINYRVSDSAENVLPMKETVEAREWAGTAVAASDDGGFACSNLWEIFLKGLGLGFLALLTPCIFPMIPLTVSIFTKQASTKARGVFNAAFYGFSIIFIYTILGLFISALYGSQRLLEIAGDPWMNLFYFALLIVFGLSFLGWFDIKLPSSITNVISVKGNTQNLFGIFFLAVTLVVISFSCTFAFVGTAFALAAQGEFLCPAIAMLGFSSAIALPFFIFALFPTMLSSLPRSGGWLNSVKVNFGFIELALALTYLNTTDLIMGWHLLPRTPFLAIWIAIFLMMGLYQFEKILLPHDNESGDISWFRALVGVVSFGFSAYLIPGMFDQTLSLVEGIIPPIESGETEAHFAAWNPMDRTQFIAILATIFAFIALYLMRMFSLKGVKDAPLKDMYGNEMPGKISVPRAIFAISTLAIAIGLLPGMMGKSVHVLEYILPKSDIVAKTATLANDICNYPNKKSAHLNSNTPPGICAFYDLEQGLEYAKKVNKPVFIDFTGHSCKNCRKVEQQVWTVPSIRKMITEDYVLVSLYTDDHKELPMPEVAKSGAIVRTVGNKWREYQMENYHISAQPLYVLVDHNKQTLVPQQGYTVDTTSYKAFLQAGLDKFKGK